MPAGKLTPLQNRFCQEYLVDLNATKAAERAGYSARTAYSQGQRLLKNVEALNRIQELMKERSERTEITADRVLTELWGMATADTNELVEHRVCCCRYCWGEGNLYQRTPREMRDDRAAYERAQAKAQAKKKTDDPPLQFPPFDEQGGEGYNATKDPNADCPECFGEGVSRPTFRDSRKASPGAKALYAGVKMTKDGIEMKLHSKEKATELLGRHLGIFEKDNQQKAINIHIDGDDNKL